MSMLQQGPQQTDVARGLAAKEAPDVQLVNPNKRATPDELHRLLGQVCEEFPQQLAAPKPSVGIFSAWTGGGAGAERLELQRRARHLASRREAAGKLLEAVEREVQIIEHELKDRVEQVRTFAAQVSNFGFCALAASACPCDEDGEVVESIDEPGRVPPTLAPNTVELRSTLKMQLHAARAELHAKSAELERLRKANPLAAVAEQVNGGESGLLDEGGRAQQDPGHLAEPGPGALLWEPDHPVARPSKGAAGGPRPPPQVLSKNRLCNGACWTMVRENELATQGVCFAAWHLMFRRERWERDTQQPYGWKSVVDQSTGNTYFWNFLTGEVSWEMPVVQGQGGGDSSASKSLEQQQRQLQLQQEQLRLQQEQEEERLQQEQLRLQQEQDEERLQQEQLRLDQQREEEERLQQEQQQQQQAASRQMGNAGGRQPSGQPLEDHGRGMNFEDFERSGSKDPAAGQLRREGFSPAGPSAGPAPGFQASSPPAGGQPRAQQQPPPATAAGLRREASASPSPPAASRTVPVAAAAAAPTGQGPAAAPTVASPSAAATSGVAATTLAAGQKFEVALLRENGAKLGLEIGKWKTTHILVAGVKPGLVQEWNDANPHLKVERGDLIAAVNGTSGYEGMAKVIRDAKNLNLSMVKKGDGGHLSGKPPPLG